MKNQKQKKQNILKCNVIVVRDKRIAIVGKLL